MGTTTFVDRKGNLRNLAFTIAEVFEIETKLGIDLMDLDSVVSACTKPRDYMRLMFELSGKLEESEAEFYACFDGQTLNDAQDALWEAIELFSPRDRRELISKLVAAVRDTTEQQVRAAIDALSTKQSGNTPGNLESTPGPTLSDS